MLLIDSNIVVNPSVLKKIIASYINKQSIPLNNIYIIDSFNNNSIPNYFQKKFLTNKKQTQNKIEIRENLALIEKLLPSGWKLNRDFGFICEIVPTDNYSAFDF